MCCDGSLFDHARVTKAEQTALRGAPVEFVVDREGQPALRQPCGALKAKCCSVYDRRPRECRSFKCNLYLGVEQGTLSYADARSRIDEALALAQKAGLSLDDGTLLKQVIQKAWRGAPDDPGRVTLDRLAELLADDFLPEHDGP